MKKVIRSLIIISISFIVMFLFSFNTLETKAFGGGLDPGGNPRDGCYRVSGILFWPMDDLYPTKTSCHNAGYTWFQNYIEYPPPATPPTGSFNISMTLSPNSWTKNSVQVALTCSGSNGAVVTSCTLHKTNGISQSIDYTSGNTRYKTYTDEGEYGVYGKVSGTGANDKTTQVQYIKIDKTDPSVSFTYVTSRTSALVEQKIKITASDSGGSGLDKVKYLWSQSTTLPTSQSWTSTTSGSTITTPSLQEGNWYLYVNAEDKAKNSKTFRSSYVKLKLPDASVTTGVSYNDRGYAISDVSVSLNNFFDGIGEVDYAWSSSTTVPAQNSSLWVNVWWDLWMGPGLPPIVVNMDLDDIPLPNNTEGTRHLHIRVKGSYINDLYTYWGRTNIKIDNCFPDIDVFSTIPTETVKSANINFHFSDYGSGIYKIQYAWHTSKTTNPSSWTTITKSNLANVELTINSPTNFVGNRYLHVKAEDYAGNVTPWTSTLIKLDSIVPKLSSFDYLTDNYSWQKNHRVKVTFTDEGSGFDYFKMGLSNLDYSLTSENPPESTYKYTFNTSVATFDLENYLPFNDDVYFMYLKYYDNVGNYNQTYLGPFLVASTPPIAIVHNSNLNNNAKSTIEYNCFEHSGNSGIESCELFIDGVSKAKKYTEGTHIYNHTTLVTQEIKVVAKNKAGNEYTTYGVSISNIEINNFSKGVYFRIRNGTSKPTIKINNTDLPENKISTLSNTSIKTYYSYAVYGKYENITVSILGDNYDQGSSGYVWLEKNTLTQNLGSVELVQPNLSQNANNLTIQNLISTAPSSRITVASNGNYIIPMYYNHQYSSISLTPKSVEDIFKLSFTSNNIFPTNQNITFKSGKYGSSTLNSVSLSNSLIIYDDYTNGCTNSSSSSCGEIEKQIFAIVIDGVTLKQTIEFIFIDITSSVVIQGNTQNYSIYQGEDLVLPTIIFNDYQGNQINGDYEYVFKQNGEVIDNINNNEIGDYEIIVYGVDEYGYKTYPETFYYSIKDNIAPEIILNGDKIITLRKGEVYNDLGSILLDNHDQTRTIYSGDNVETKKVGTYMVTYYGYDNAGNLSEVITRKIIVKRSMTDIMSLVLMSLTALGLAVVLLSKKRYNTIYS